MLLYSSFVELFAPMHFDKQAFSNYCRKAKKMPWYAVVALVIGIPIYAAGYFWCAVNVWHACMDNHPMQHASDYRMTDGYMPSFFMGFLWPVMALGVGIKLLANSVWPEGPLATASNADVLLGLLMTLVCGVILAALFVRFVL
jgi:peptidoglycan/LPS O-acetylase OafA/YrhL